MTGADARFTVDAPSGASALVVVGGWHGARDKNVKKYTDEFNKWGVATVRTIMPGHLTFSPVNSGRAAFTRDLLLSTRAARQTHGLADKPLYFMFMSNGGCWIWATMHVEGSLDGEFADLGEALSGVMFDSSPAFMTVGSGAKVLRLGAHPALALAVTVAFYVAAGIMGLYSLLTTASLDAVPPKMFWRAVRDAKPRAKELYLFSDADALCDAARVAALIAERGENGAKTEFVRWEHSRHCAHLLDEREQYLGALRAFLGV